MTTPRGYREWPILFGCAIVLGDSFSDITSETKQIAAKLHAMGLLSLRDVACYVFKPYGREHVRGMLQCAGRHADALIDYSVRGAPLEVVWKLTEDDADAKAYKCAVVGGVRDDGCLTVMCRDDGQLYNIDPNKDELCFAPSNGVAMVLDTHGNKHEGYYTEHGRAHGRIKVTANTAIPQPPTYVVYDNGCILASVHT